MLKTGAPPADAGIAMHSGGPIDTHNALPPMLVLAEDLIRTPTAPANRRTWGQSSKLTWVDPPRRPATAPEPPPELPAV